MPQIAAPSQPISSFVIGMYEIRIRLQLGWVGELSVLLPAMDIQAFKGRRQAAFSSQGLVSDCVRCIFVELWEECFHMISFEKGRCPSER